MAKVSTYTISPDVAGGYVVGVTSAGLVRRYPTSSFGNDKANLDLSNVSPSVGRSALGAAADVDATPTARGLMTAAQAALVATVPNKLDKVGSVTAGALALGDQSGLIANPNFENPRSKTASSEGWTLQGNSVIVAGSGGLDGRWRLYNTNVFSVAMSDPIYIIPARRLYVEGIVRNGRGSGTSYLLVYWYDNSDTQIGSANFVASTTELDTEVWISGISAPAPAGVAYARVSPYCGTASGDFWVSRVRANWAINTGQLVSKSVTFDVFANAASASLVGATAAGVHADLTQTQARTVLGLATTDTPTLGGLTLGSAGLVLAPKTFATLPTASGATGQSYRVTDRNHRTATSDGTAWRWGDNTVAA